MKTNSISYWQQTALPVELSTDLPPSVEVVVIGGGLMGTAATYWLVHEGIKVALLERKQIGWGATGRNGGFVVAGPAGTYPATIARLGHESASAVLSDTLINQRLMREVLGEENISCDYREPGMIRLAVGAEQEEELHAEVAALQADGFGATFLDRATLEAMIETKLSPEIRAGRLKPEQGLIHSARFVRGLAQAAIRRGARAYEAEAVALSPDGEHLRIQTSRGNIHASTVIVATNVWIGKLLPMLADYILSEREQMLAYAPLPPVFSHALSARVTSGEYFQQTPDGTILLGGCNTVAPQEDMGIWEMTPLPVVQNALEAVLPQLFPALAPLRIVGRWAGLLDMATDFHPIVDVVPDMPQVFFVCGLSGHGMPFGLRFGQLLTKAVVGGGVMPAALAPYRLDRPSLRTWQQVS